MCRNERVPAAPPTVDIGAAAAANTQIQPTHLRCTFVAEQTYFCTCTYHGNQVPVWVNFVSFDCDVTNSYKTMQSWWRHACSLCGKNLGIELTIGVIDRRGRLDTVVVSARPWSYPFYKQRTQIHNRYVTSDANTLMLSFTEKECIVQVQAQQHLTTCDSFH